MVHRCRYDEFDPNPQQVMGGTRVLWKLFVINSSEDDDIVL